MAIINQIVNGSGSGPVGIYREYEIANDTDHTLIANTTTSHLASFAGAGYITDRICAHMYENNTVVTGVFNMQDVLYAGSYACYYMCYGCTGITGVDARSVRGMSDEYCFAGAFSGCTSLLSQNVKFSSLTGISGSHAAYSMFSGDTALTDIDCIWNLSNINGSYAAANMFQGCTGLTTPKLWSLKSFGSANAMSNMFAETNVTDIYFPAFQKVYGGLTSMLTNLVRDVANVTIHFPSNAQSIIETMTGYSTTAPFGAVSGTVLFDLPAAVTLTGADTNTYERDPKFDTAGALAWYDTGVGDRTIPVYTSGTADPAVSDTIYSDSACTTPVTTISSIS